MHCRHIRQSSIAGNIWDLSSPFFELLQLLEKFYTHLPTRFALTNVNIYMHKDQNMLGSVFALHLFFHAAVCDLTRVSLPGFKFPLAECFENAPIDFIVQCQKRACFHAGEISDILRQGKKHGQKAFDDYFAADAAFESTKIQIISSSILQPFSELSNTARRNVSDNMRIIASLNQRTLGPNPHVSVAAISLRLVLTPSRSGTSCHFALLLDSRTLSRPGRVLKRK